MAVRADNPDHQAQRQRDRKLVTACLAGDEDAWATLWDRYGPLVKAIARRCGCDSEEARDVLQMVAVVALEKLDTLREPEKLPGWLAGTARFQSLALVRRRLPSADLDSTPHGSSDSSEGRVISDQQLGLLRHSYQKLDPRCQRVIRRLHLKEPADSYAEVAEDEGLSTTSIGPIKNRCLKRLRTQFESVSRSRTSTHFKDGG